MNTTAAATQAGVTVATIRTWCRVGAVSAVKAAGRWTIDAASLAHRIVIGARRTTVDTPDYTTLAAEARALADTLIPPKGCHPADRIGGFRDRSGVGRARGLASQAAGSYDRAALAASEGRDYDARDNVLHADEAMTAARAVLAKLGR